MSPPFGVVPSTSSSCYFFWRWSVDRSLLLSYYFSLFFSLPSFSVSINLFAFSLPLSRIFRVSLSLLRLRTTTKGRSALLTLLLFWEREKKKIAGSKPTRYPTPKQRLISSYRYLLLLSSANSLSGCVLTNAFVPGRGTALLSRSKLRGIVLARVSVFPLFIPNSPRLHRVTGNNRRSKYGHGALSV